MHLISWIYPDGSETVSICCFFLLSFPSAIACRWAFPTFGLLSVGLSNMLPFRCLFQLLATCQLAYLTCCPFMPFPTVCLSYLLVCCQLTCPICCPFIVFCICWPFTWLPLACPLCCPFIAFPCCLPFLSVGLLSVGLSNMLPIYCLCHLLGTLSIGLSDMLLVFFVAFSSCWPPVSWLVQYVALSLAFPCCLPFLSIGLLSVDLSTMLPIHRLFHLLAFPICWLPVACPICCPFIAFPCCLPFLSVGLLSVGFSHTLPFHWLFPAVCLSYLLPFPTCCPHVSWRV